MRARSIIISTLLVLTMFISGCATYKTYSSSLTKEFTKSIVQSHPVIESLKIQYGTPTITFSYKISDGVTEEEVIEIFKETRTFFTSINFQDELIQKYDKIFEGSTPHYPTVCISFFTQNTEASEYDYLSSANTDNERYQYYNKWGLKRPDKEDVQIDY